MPDRRPPAREEANTAAGWQALRSHLAAVGATPAGTCVVLEATGTYWVGRATDVTDAGWTVSVVPPASVRSYAPARLRRAKTDAVDAYVLARYGHDLQPARWTPPPAELRALQLLLRQREDLVALRTQTTNRPPALAQLPTVPAEVQPPLVALRAVLDEQVAALEQAITQRVATLSEGPAADVARLDGISGVGLLTATLVRVETAPLLAAGATPKQVVAAAGLDPAPHQSGTSVRGPGQLSQTAPPPAPGALHGRAQRQAPNGSPAHLLHPPARAGQTQARGAGRRCPQTARVDGHLRAAAAHL